MARDSQPSPRLLALGAELRNLRKSAALTVRDIATALGGHHSRYARIERGEIVPSTEEVASILTVLRAPGDVRDSLVDIARQVGGNWVQPGPRAASSDLSTLLEFEKTATKLVDVAPILLPGLLQTADYARAVMPDVQPTEVDSLVAMRVGRREVLTRSKEPPEFVAFIAERALVEPLGGSDVMAEQLHHIVGFGKRDNIAVRVVGLREAWNPSHMGPFMLFEFANSARAVHLEHLGASAFLSKPRDVQPFQDAIPKIQQVAFSKEGSRELILEHARSWEDGHHE